MFPRFKKNIPFIFPSKKNEKNRSSISFFPRFLKKKVSNIFKIQFFLIFFASTLKKRFISSFYPFFYTWREKNSRLFHFWIKCFYF